MSKNKTDDQLEGSMKSIENPEKVYRISFEITPSLHKKLKVASALKSVTMGDMVQGCISEFLSTIELNIIQHQNINV